MLSKKTFYLILVNNLSRDNFQVVIGVRILHMVISVLLATPAIIQTFLSSDVGCFQNHLHVYCRFQAIEGFLCCPVESISNVEPKTFPTKDMFFSNYVSNSTTDVVVDKFLIFAK